MPASSHGLPTSAMRRLRPPQDAALDLDRVDPGPVRRVALELVPARDRALPQLVARADDLPGVAVGAGPDRQRQAVVALLADHPVAHVPEPVELALLEADARRQPRDLAGRVAQLGSRSGSMAMNHSSTRRKIELGPAAPADRVASGGTARAPRAGPCARGPRPRPAPGRRPSGSSVAPAIAAVCQPKPSLKTAELVDRVDHRQVELLRQREVLLAAARRDVHDAGPLVVRHLVPGDDSMRPRPARPAARRTDRGRSARPARRPCASRTTVASRSDPRLRAVRSATSGAHRGPRPARRSAPGGPRRPR